MKTDYSKLPREEVEARITTMLMGEMPADDAAELMEFVSRDSELLKLHDDLKRTISLVEEATTNAGEEPAKLSAGRREALLEQFKLIPAQQFVVDTPKESSIRPWFALAAMIAFLLVVSGLMLPALSKSKSKSMAFADDRDDGGVSVKFLSLRPRAHSNKADSVPVPESRLREQEVPSQPRNRLMELVEEEKPRRAPSAPAVSGPVAVRGRSDVSADAALPKEKAIALREELGEVERALNNAPQTKIELPGGAPVESPVKLKNESWFQAGQTRGYGGIGDGSGVFNNRADLSARAAGTDTAQRLEPNAQAGGYFTFGGAAFDQPTRGLVLTDAEDKTTSHALVPETPPNASGVAAGKNLMLAYGDRFGVTPTELAAQAANGVANRPTETTDFFDARGAAEAKKDTGAAIDALTGLPVASTSSAAVSSIDPLTGLPAATPGAAKATTEEAEILPGAMGGGAMASMQYYMKNPELMKRYFPQMYAMMEKQQSVSNASGAAFGMPGPSLPPGKTVAQNSLPQPMPMLAPPMYNDPYARYRSRPLTPDNQPAPSRAGLPSRKPEQQVAPGNDLNVIVAKAEAAPQKEIRDVAKKSELAAASSVDKSRALTADELGRGESVALQQKSLDDALAAVRQNQGAAEMRLTLNEPVAAGRRITEIREAEKDVKENAERELFRRDVAPQRPPASSAIPQPEISTAENAFSTFSLNVSDVSFKLAAASLEKGLMPEAATVRSEEFINAFDYRDPEPQGAPIGFVWERARYPFAQGRDLLRFSVKTAASGRQAGRPLNLVLLLDSSGSMERADRVRILQECLKTLAAQLRPEDKVSVVAFARTARLWIDGLPGSQANELAQRVGNLTPEGGTNLEEAMKVAYETAQKHFNAEGVNRVVLLTDGAANLGDVEPESLKRKVESERKKGVALDCFGIGWEGLNDELLETLSRNGDGRYGFVNTPEAAASEFAGQLAGALQVAASDVKVQVEWNPKRVTAFRQIGYAKHQLTKEQFRDNTVDAAEIGAAEAGNALYTVQVDAAGEGPLGTVRVRFKVPGTNDYREHAWPLNYEGASKALENANYTLRLAGAASAFSEWLVSSPYAAEVTTDRLLTILSGVPEHFAPDTRPMKLEWMIRQAKSLAGK